MVLVLGDERNNLLNPQPIPNPPSTLNTASFTSSPHTHTHTHIDPQLASPDPVSESDTIKALSAVVAASTGKPESYVLVTLRSGTPVCFGGTEDPAAYGELLSIGAIGGDKNKAICKAVSEVVSAKLGVPANRFYLSFHDSARTDFGFNGGTF